MDYRVKQWRLFQHYRDRNPPWIKLHFSLLSSMDWVTLDDASRVLAIACMLIASRNDGVVPGDPAYIKRVAYLNKLPNFKPLIDCGFLEPASDCKQMLADARPETETETETETEKRQSSASLAIAFSAEAGFVGIDAYRQSWEKAYPAIDLKAELAKAQAWLIANPKNRKSNYARFLNNWFVRAQDSAPRKSELPAVDWCNTATGIEKRGAELGIHPTDPKFNHWQEFKAAVLHAAQERTH